jgi:hypothetical protein
MRRGVRHTCVFEKNTGPLDRIVHALVAQEAGEMWDAIVQFIGQSNITISPAASPEFRQVIQTASGGGFDRALKNPKGDVDQEFKAFCPSRGPMALRKYVVQAASAERDAMEDI